MSDHTPAVLAAVDVIQSALRHLSPKERAQTLELVNAATSTSDRYLVERILKETNYNIGETAARLGLSRRTLNKRMHAYKLKQGRVGRRPKVLADLTARQASAETRAQLAKRIKDRENHRDLEKGAAEDLVRDMTGDLK